jgi:hypothetical protein
MIGHPAPLTGEFEQVIMHRATRSLTKMRMEALNDGPCLNPLGEDRMLSVEQEVYGVKKLHVIAVVGRRAHHLNHSELPLQKTAAAYEHLYGQQIKRLRLKLFWKTLVYRLFHCTAR